MLPDELKPVGYARSCRKLREHILRLYEFRGTVHQFPDMVLPILREALNADAAIYCEISPDQDAVRVVNTSQTPDYEKRVAAYLHLMSKAHPFFQLSPEFYQRRVLHQGDFFSDRQFYDTPIYCEVMKPSRQRHVLQTCVPSGGWTMNLEVNREGGSAFGERERGLMETLLPHLEQVYQLARWRTLERLSLREKIVSFYPKLSPRLADVVCLLLKGMDNHTISERLKIGPDAVKAHLKRSFSHFSVESRSALISKVYQRLNDHLPMQRPDLFVERLT